MVGLGTVASIILIPLIVARVLMWNKVVPATALVETAKQKAGGKYFTYRYDLGRSNYQGKFSVVPNSSLYAPQPGDQITVYVHPGKPGKSLMPL